MRQLTGFSTSSDDDLCAELRLDIIAGADARGAHLDSLGLTVDLDADILDVRLKGALVGFHDVQTDTANFLRQTAADNVTAFELLFAANTANIAHLRTSLPSEPPGTGFRHIYIIIKTKKWWVDRGSNPGLPP